MALHERSQAEGLIPGFPEGEKAARLVRLEREVTECRRCPRLVEWRERVRARSAPPTRGRVVLGTAVAGFGDPAARIFLLGLAPAAHGGNRTGRVFTGDRSGDFLEAMHRTGLANQPDSRHPGDGLELRGAFVAAAVRCAPPANRPLPGARQLPLRTPSGVAASSEVRVVVCLGSYAWDAALRLEAMVEGRRSPGPASARGRGRAPSGRVLVGTYHPSQQNTFTGKLTPGMLEEVLRRVARADRHLALAT